MFSGLKIGTRLAVGFGVVLVALAAICALSARNILESVQLIHQISDRHVRTAALSRAQSAVWAMRWGVARYAGVTTDAAKRKQLTERSADNFKEFEAAMASYGKAHAGVLTADEQAVSAQLTEAFRKYSEARLRWFELMSAEKMEEANAFRTQTMTPAAILTVQTLAKLIEVQGDLVQADEAGALADMRRSMILLAALGAAALLLAGIASWLLARSITGPLREAVASVETVARGELTAEIRVKSGDEVGQLLTALQAMQQNLKGLVGDVLAGARVVADTSAQISQGNADLSQRTEEQASTLEETASSLEELTSTVDQNAENARQASQFAIGASEVARKGGNVVGEVVSTMTGIADSSKRIADIIGVIDGIAFQTNILALNAAVEAARAGEQGRGFAVVAAEVRNLAQRSAAAAREIKGLIGDSVGRVEAGTRLVDAAGRTMQEIVDSVKKVSDLIAEIAAASQEQSAGIGQVNTAIVQMERVVQQNASLVEEAAAATESMTEQSRSLLASVARFKLDAEAAPQGLPAAAPAIAPVHTVAAPGPLAPIKVRAPARLAQAAPNGGAWQEF